MTIIKGLKEKTVETKSPSCFAVKINKNKKSTAVFFFFF